MDYKELIDNIMKMIKATMCTAKISSWTRRNPKPKLTPEPR